MKNLFSLLTILILTQSCQDEKEVSSTNIGRWDNRTIKHKLIDSLTAGTTYLSVYSQIYSQTEHKTLDLTATVSMRNTDQSDTIFINTAEYFDTKGSLIRTYINKPIFIVPMETVEIVIDELDQIGGTGANFLFNWSSKPSSNKPLFEAVMISTSGQQGFAFKTDGKNLN